MAKVLLILSMGRSGTSLTASWLKSCGLFIGNLFSGGDIGNKNGYFEDKVIESIQENILNDNKKKWHCIKLSDKIVVRENRKRELRKIIEERINLQWGFKDPKTSLFIPFWLDALSSDGYYLVLFRDYKLVVDSLMRWWLKAQKTRRNRFLGVINSILFNKIMVNNSLANDYLETWIVYYSNILSNLKLIDSVKYKIINADEISIRDIEIFEWLDSEGFKLSYNQITEIFKIDEYSIIPTHEFEFKPSLILQANNIMKELELLKNKY